MIHGQALANYAGAATMKRFEGYCLGEIERLKRTFSPHRSDGEILHLNREGRLVDPSHDFRLRLGVTQRHGNFNNATFHGRITEVMT